jgi:hypothetical protein
MASDTDLREALIRAFMAKVQIVETTFANEQPLIFADEDGLGEIADIAIKVFKDQKTVHVSNLEPNTNYMLELQHTDDGPLKAQVRPIAPEEFYKWLFEHGFVRAQSTPRG